MIPLKTCRSLSRGEQSLVRWAIHQLHDIDALSRMVDPYLHGAYPVKSLSRFADIISRCIQASYTSSTIELHISGIVDCASWSIILNFLVICTLIINIHFLQQKIHGYEWRLPLLEDL